MKAANLRKDIQALRALAVMAVFVYHMRPEFLTGGFVGVDVFFVLSGFLISSHLISELHNKGRIELGKFWAQRAKRLLPASLTVLAVTAIAVWFFAPFAFQDRFFRDISAATLYVANWVFAYDAVDYLAADNSPSVVQHFWSLGVEEQLYLFWPIMLTAVWQIASRKQIENKALCVTLSLVLLLSLAYSSVLVLDADPIAYFSTFSRAWEFASGALLALYVSSKQSQKESNLALRTFASWAGWIGLLLFMALFDASAGFPGLNAIPPVLFSLMIIWASDPVSKFSPYRVLHLRPVQFLGDASYSIYLWHWPILIFVQFYYPNTAARWLVVIFLITLALSALSMKYIENPFRFGKLKTSLRPRVVFAGVAASMLILVSATQASGYFVRIEVAKQEAAELAFEQEIEKRAIESQSSEFVWDEITCMGPNFLVQRDCAEMSWDGVIPAIKTGEETAHDIEPLERVGSEKGCLAWGESYDMIRCVYGVMGGTKIALIGDSHAYHWIPAFDQVAKQNNYELHFLARAGCPYNTKPREARGEHVRGCFSWMSEVRDYLSANRDFDFYIMANFIGSRFEGSGEFGAKQPNGIEGYKEAWQDLSQFGAKIIVLKDTPFIGEPAWNCAVANATNLSKCDVTLDSIKAIFDNSTFAAEELGYPVLDFEKYFCKDEMCPIAVGGIRVYRDSNHMTGTYNLLLAPYLKEQLELIVAR